MSIAKTLLTGAACWLGLILAVPVFGDSLTYLVTVNTTSETGVVGFIDLQLDPGSAGAAPVTATINGFIGATLSSTNPLNFRTTFVTGSLPGTLAIANTNTLNDYTEALTFGTGLTFEVTLSGTGVSLAGLAGGTSGTTFILDFLNSAQTAYLLSSDPTGSSTSATDPLWAAAVIDISNKGLLTPIANPGPNNGPSVVSLSLVPEPSTWVLLGGGLLVLAISGRRQIRRWYF